ncbi:hypothetical protein B6N60_01106 [Richelia sinica FACHB-800]|uniref:UPF0102 protein B6N60_01106 n=1 Tax=Richelia sinica FACHB-800 TaxID=1357546 RepID=A0A975Y3S2_9NOST|nr:YraN family protein [Richelia sinica]MBD2664341.1 YraN family protein [Richelia sinica FACHB-800]QXE22423.1 hypothetical protein B6N60_01106 [Richelia sinica FACHB-800]
MPNPPPSNYPLDIGHLGEDLVAKWLESTGWEVLHRRFACRWGEIDLIAQYHGNNIASTVSGDRTQPSTLAFVEVKTRSRGSWDAGGRNAITAKKQEKLWHTAEIFLAKYPEKADYPCRFDVAIVFCQPNSPSLQKIEMTPKSLFSLSTDLYRLDLQEYIPAAFG